MDALDPLLAAYLAIAALLAVYGVHRITLLARFRWPREADPALDLGNDEAPFVTVQLPLFNERTVAQRLLRAVGELDYPRERFEIQVLDDSTDETRDLVDREVAALRSAGVDARVVRREGRVGFKAGALDDGTRLARGDLLCVFDADFMPRPDFVLRLVDAFRDPRVGMVQARWEHSNRGESLLTRAEAVLLDGHFVIEHLVRHESGCFFNFNGTAGIWRRAAIEAAGGWQHDTLTEDLDLSYRAQLCGWRFVYRPLVAAPAELPPNLVAFQSQQHRWAKGSVQVARKLGWQILRAPLPAKVKLEALAHLSGNVGYPLILAMAVLLPAVAMSRTGSYSLLNLLFFVVCTCSVFAFYERSQQALGRSRVARWCDTLAAITLGIGMSARLSRAVLSGLGRRTGEFVRTPKRGDGDPAHRYFDLRRRIPIVELAVALWIAFGVVKVAQAGHWGTLPFLLLFLSGFAWVATLSLQSWRDTNPSSRRGRADETLPWTGIPSTR